MELAGTLETKALNNAQEQNTNRSQGQLDSETVLNLGDTLLERGRIGAAVDCYRQSVKLDPTASQSWQKLAKALTKQEKWSEAAAAYNSAIELTPEDFRLHDQLGETLTKLGKIEAAIACHRRTLELFPNSAKESFLYRIKGNKTWQIKSHELAVLPGQMTQQTTEGQLKSLRGNTSWVFCGPYIHVPDGLYLIRVNFEWTAEISDVLEEKFGASVGFKFDIVSERGSCLWYQADVYTNQHQLELIVSFIEAKETEFRFFALEKEFTFNSIDLTLLYQPTGDSNGSYYWELGNLLQEKGQQDKALAAYRKAAKFNPEYLEASAKIYRQNIERSSSSFLSHYYLGETLAQQGELQEAIACYQRTIEIQPNADKSYWQLAEALSKIGNQVEAIAKYRKAIALNPHLSINKYSFLDKLEAIRSWRIRPDRLTMISGQITLGSNPQLLSLKGNRGWVNCGPYINLPDGLYKFRIDYEFPNQASVEGGEIYPNNGFKFDIVSHGGQCRWYEETVNICDRKQEINLKIELIDANAIEIRFYAIGVEFIVNSIDINLLYQSDGTDVNPEDAVFYFDLGSILQKKGNFEQSIAAYHMAIKLNPQKFLEVGIASCQKLAKINPMGFNYFKLGIWLAEKKIQGDDAIVCLEDALTCYLQGLILYPNQAENYPALKKILVQNSSQEEVMASYRKVFNGEVYDNIWGGLNDLNLVDEIIDYSIEINSYIVYQYFGITSNYKVINLDSIADTDRKFLEERGLSLAIIELIIKDEITLEEVYINSFGDSANAKLSRKVNKQDRVFNGDHTDVIHNLKKGRYFQSSIVETGYIYSMCPASGKILRSNQSFPLHDPQQVAGGCWPPMHFYRFVGSEVFYLICANFLGDKAFLYFPKHELIIRFCGPRYITEEQMINMFKCNLVSLWREVKLYISTEKKEVALNLGWDGNLGHFLMNDLSGLQFLHENGTLQKVHKFLTGPTEFISIGGLFPEIAEDQVTQISDPLILFKTIVENNYFTVWVTDLIIKEDLAQKITHSSIKRCSQDFLQGVGRAKTKHFPLVYMQIRIHNRLWLSYIEGIANIIKSLYANFPNLGIVFDGWGRCQEVETDFEKLNIARETAAMKKIIDLLPSGIKTYSIIGSMNYEKVVWTQASDTFILPEGSGLLWEVWVANKVGVIYGRPAGYEALKGMIMPVRENAVDQVFVVSHYENSSQSIGIRDYECDWKEIYREAFKIVKVLSQEGR